MAWTSPTLSDIIERVEQDFSARFFGSSAPLRHGVLWVLARVWAGVVYLLTLYLDWIYRNGFLHLCDDDQVVLHCTEIGVYRTPAAYASGIITGTGTPGAVIAQGTIVQTSGGDLQYQTVDEVTIGVDGTYSVTVTAMDGGAQYNLPQGGTLYYQVAPSQWDDEATIGEGGISGGDDIEDLEDLRNRGLYKKRNPPQGGARADYVIWATSQPNVTDAFITEGFPQANSVQVVVADYDKTELSPPQPPTVDAADVQRVHDYICDEHRRPLTATVEVSSVVPRMIGVSVEVSPNTASVRDAIADELRDLFAAEGIPRSTIGRETILATVARATGVRAVELIDVTQDGEIVEEIVLGYRDVAWLDSLVVREVS